MTTAILSKPCAACGRTPEPADRFCPGCGAPEAVAAGPGLAMGPAAVSDWSRLTGPGEHGPFAADEPLVSWAACGEVLVGLRDDGRDGEFVSVEVRDEALTFVPAGRAAGLGKPIGPLLGGRLGVHAVSAETAATWTPDAPPALWKAPGEILAAAVSDCGELWTAVRRGDELLVLAGTAGGGMSLVAALSGFVAPDEETVGLAVDSEIPGRGTVLLVGGGRAAVIEDGAVAALVPAPPETTASVLEAPCFQPPWRIGRPWLTGLGGERAVVVWDGVHLAWMALRLRARSARALVMTRMGACVALCESETLTITWNAVGSRLSSRPAEAAPLHGAGLGLEDEVLVACRDAAGAGFLLQGAGGARASLRVEPRLPATTDMLRPAVWLPPVATGDAVWAAMLWRSRLVAWRCPLAFGDRA